MGKEYPELRLSSEQAASLGVYYNEICRLALGNKVIHVQADIAEDSGESLITLTPEFLIVKGLLLVHRIPSFAVY